MRPWLNALRCTKIQDTDDYYELLFKHMFGAAPAAVKYATAFQQIIEGILKLPNGVKWTALGGEQVRKSYPGLQFRV